MTTSNPKSRKGRRGQALVESALILMLFLALLIGALDFGELLLFHQSRVVRVRLGLRGAAMQAYDETSIKNFIRYKQTTQPSCASPFLGLADSNIAITRYDTGYPTERIQIAIVDYQFRFFSPFIARTFTNNLAV